MKKIELVLPSSGKRVTMREATGLDEFQASRKFLDKDDHEKAALEGLEVLAKTVEIDGKQLNGYEELLTLPAKDIEFLLLAYNKLNRLSLQETKTLQANLGEVKPLMEVLFLIRNLNVTYEEAMKMPIKEREILLEAVRKFLGLDRKNGED